jgi:hypothetical protein
LNRIKKELGDPCKKPKWMSMPTSGDLIAITFQTPVFFWSASFSQTFFPHFCPPNDNPPIFISFLSGVYHFVAIELEKSLYFPAPQVLRQWRQTAIPEALGWEARYYSCFQLMARVKAESTANNKYY